MGGGFHCDVATGRGCAVGSHAFSADGLAWTFSTTVAYNTTVTYTDGTAATLARRERPQIVFEGGEPAYLTNGATHNAPPPSGPPAGAGAAAGAGAGAGAGGGVRSALVQGDHSFTLIVPIKRK